MMVTAPTTKYARSGDVHIAYQVMGEGRQDLLKWPGTEGLHHDTRCRAHCCARFVVLAGLRLEVDPPPQVFEDVIGLKLA